MPSRSQPWPSGASYASRWRCAQRVARRCRAALHAYPNVLSVDVGFEHTGRRTPRGGIGTFERIELGDDVRRAVVPCVIVLVTRKWRDRTARRGKLPSTLPGYVVVRGGRKRVDVPVSVVEQTPSRLHGLACRAAGPGEPGELGAVTAFVRKPGDPQQYFLGCHHVLAMTERRRLPDAGVPPVRVEVDGSIGELSDLPRDPESCDAALATCDRHRQIGFGSPDGPVVLDDILSREQPIEPDLLALTPRGIQYLRANALLESHSATYYVETANSKQLTFSRVLHCLADDNSDLEPGDSGSPIVTRSGTLVAMHYAGSDSSSSGAGPDSYALMACDVFRAFRGPINLS